MRLENYLLTKKLEQVYNQIKKYVGEDSWDSMYLIKEGDYIAVGCSYFMYREKIENNNLENIIFKDGIVSPSTRNILEFFDIKTSEPIIINNIGFLKEGLHFEITEQKTYSQYFYNNCICGTNYLNREKHVLLNKKLLKMIQKFEGKKELEIKVKEGYKNITIINNNYLLCPLTW